MKSATIEKRAFRGLLKPLLGILLSTGITVSAVAAQHVYMTGSTNPWGLSSGSGSNEYAMDAAFGAGDWTRYQGFTTSAFAADTRFVFLDGSDVAANELNGFLTANGAAVENYVAGGGALFINAAPNQGFSFSLGFGVTLTYDDFSDTATATPAGNTSGIFDGIAAAYSGNYFSHASVSGVSLTSLLDDSDGDSVLAVRSFGNGFAAFGGMTLPYYHSPDPDSNILRARILEYIAAGAVVAQVPEPGSLFLIGVGLLTVSVSRRVKNVRAS